MSNVKDISKKIFSGKYTLFAAGIAVLVLMLLLFYPKQESEELSAQEKDTYLETLQTNLQNVIESMEGVDSCNVMITLSSGTKYEYATDISMSENSGTDDKTSTQSKSDITVISDKTTGEKAVVVKEIYPEIKGAVIVCQGTETDALTLEIKKAVSVALGLGSDKICVIIK